MFEQNPPPNFEQAILPHLDVVYNLARWLMRNEQDAQASPRKHTYVLSDSFRASAAVMRAPGS
jgi:hypothetical protein